MRVLDLFSGIGGFSLGLERAGMQTVAFCERDEYCRAVLAKHWPGVPCFDDIHNIDADGLGRLGRIDLVCGGFPCQPFSVAGRQKGKDDDRHLWPQMLRVIALARPTWVIGENVAGLIAMALDDVLADLESIGYTTRTFVIPAAAVGAPHRRDRLWIVANTTSECEREQTNETDAITTGRQTRNEPIDSSHDVANASSERLQGQRNRTSIGEQESNEQRRSLAGTSNENASNSDSDTIRQQSERIGRRGDTTFSPVSSWWSSEPDVGRVAHGVPRRMDRLRCLGNAVVPQIPEIIGRAIMKQLHQPR